MKPFHAFLTAALAASGLLAQAPKAVPLVLERVLTLPIQVPDTQVALDKLGEVIVIAPDFFVFTAHAAIPSPGAFNTGWGCFSWKGGELKTVLLDTKAFKPLHGEPFPEKTNLGPDRSRFLASAGRLYFTASTGWVAFTPQDHRSWTGGLYTWDGQRIQKVLAAGDTVPFNGATRTVKAANLLAVRADGSCLTYLRTDKESGLALVKPGSAEPFFQDGPEGTLGTILAAAPQGEAIFALLEPKKGEPFLAAITQGRVVRLLTLNGPDPTDPASRLYGIVQGEAADAEALAFWCLIYKEGKVDWKRGKLLLWDRGAFRAMHETETQVRLGGTEDQNEQWLLGCWWTNPAKRQCLLFLRKRVDTRTAGFACRFYDGGSLNDVAAEGALPNLLPRAWPVPGAPGALTLAGFDCPNFPKGEWRPVEALFEDRPPYRLQPGPELVSTNRVRFRPTVLRGGEGQRFVALLPDGFYVTKPDSPAKP